jgi:hypothetical protein
VFDDFVAVNNNIQAFLFYLFPLVVGPWAPDKETWLPNRGVGARHAFDMRG